MKSGSTIAERVNYQLSTRHGVLDK